MQRVKRSTAVATKPAPPSGGTPGYFAQPDPQGGVPATVPGYEWFNNVQEELVAIVQAAGLNLSDNDSTQLLQAIVKKGFQGGYFNTAIAGGAADAITLAFTPAMTSFGQGPIWWRATAANATATPTVKRDGLAAKTLVKGAGFSLAVGDIPGAGAWMCSQYDPTSDKEVLLNPAFGVTARGNQTFTASGNFTVPAGVTTVFLTGTGPGGGGAAYSSATSGGGGGGGGGSCLKRAVSVTPGQVIPVTIGAPGAGSQTQNVSGTSGGTTSFGALLTLGGGLGGTPAGPGGNGGSVSGGTGVGVAGQNGEQYNPINTGAAKGGDGGGSMFGQGGKGGGQGSSNSAGGYPSGFGAGGGGGATNRGADGAPSFLIIEW